MTESANRDRAERAGSSPQVAGTALAPPKHPLLWLGIGLALLPQFVAIMGMTDVAATKLAIFILVGLGYNILLGYTGLVSFGHSMFFGFAAYATALLQIHVFPGSFWLPIAGAVVLTGVLSAVVGFLILRRRGVYFSLLTLAFTSMTFYVIYRWTDFTGGEDGLRGLMRPHFLGIDVDDSGTFYYLVAAIVFSCGAILWRLVNSPLGRSFVAIRENEQRSGFIGYPVMLLKLCAFVTSAVFTGLGGALYAMVFYIVTPDVVHITLSGEILVMTVIGGSGAFLGPAIGAVFYIVFQDWLSAYTTSWQLWFGLLFIGFILFSPEGLVGVTRRVMRIWRTEAAQIAAMAARATPPTVWQVPALLHAPPAGSGDGPILATRGITKRFGAFTAVDAVDLAIPAGRLSVIIGPNGAGKTTLFNLMSGMFPPDGGQLTYLGRSMAGHPTRDFAAAGLCRSFQIVNLFEALSVEENIRLAVQARHSGRFSPVRRADRVPEVMRETREIIHFIGLDGIEAAKAADLSGGGKRLLEIAVALACRPRVLLLDEPMAGLAATERNRFAGMVKALSEHVTVVMIEHDMDRAFELAEHVTVMHEGRVLADGLPDEVRHNPLVQQIYLGRGAAAATAATMPAHAMPSPAAEPLLRLEGVNTFYGTSHILHDVSLDLKPGEIVGLLGRNGAGKSTTIKSVMGLAPPRSGTITLAGSPIAGLEPVLIARRGIGYVPQGRRLFGNLTVAENLELGGMQRRSGQGTAWDHDRIFAHLPKVERLLNRKAGVLSGGEQQMVAIARALSGDVRVLLLDEPFEGLAPAVVDEVFDAVSKMRKAVPILIVEHDLDRVLALADRVYVLDRGAVTHEGLAAALHSDLDYRKRILWL
jgi:ABC-type branched-subunit amino acid transport system ATPase component/ABC-type branched-subunit amino acid transport system permease subunit